MRYITERELRDLFAGGVPERYDVPGDAKLTPAARQYLTDLRLFRHPAPPERAANAVRAGEKKPEHMTHLNGRELVCKTHPRIHLRGKLDTLECEILLLQTECRGEWSTRLSDALQLVRLVLSSEVRDAPMPAWKLDGMDAENVHRCSHHPEQFGFSGHILPTAEHGAFAAKLNRLRALTRETELAAVEAFWDGQCLKREDCVMALNRLSSYFYVLQLRAVSALNGGEHGSN